MISFIVIGKNEGWRLTNCLDSILIFISNENITDFEIIYVDSNSTDDSIQRARAYRAVKVYLITGNCNSAIARNVGAQQAKYNILFFLDGDMELLPEFFEFVFNKSTQTLLYPFTNGHMIEKYYDSDFNYLFDRNEKIGEKPFFEPVTGGLMIVEKRLWEKLGGMDERLIRNQDLDFGLRMSKNGVPVLKDNHFWIIHHTISYYEKTRFSSFYRSKALLSPGILMRKHILNFTYLKYFRRYVFYEILLFTSFTMLFISPINGILLLLFYIFIQVIRTIVNSKDEEYLVKSFTFKIIFNIYSLLGFLFYYPAKHSYKFTFVK